jgi:hypothetical protein
MAETYAPCRNGLHVCGASADLERPITIANVPFVSAASFDVLEAAYEITDFDESGDLVIDFLVDGDIVSDFWIRRQQLEPLLKDARAKAETRPTEGRR